MDIRFENCYVCDRKLLAEFGRKHSVGPTPLSTAVTVVLMVLGLPLLYIGGVRGSEFGMLWCCYLVMILVQFLPQYYAWSVLRNTRKQNDGVMPQTRVVYSDENIQMFEGMVHLTIEYRKIVKTVRLKNGYALMTGKRTAVLVKPEEFTVGDFQSFKGFIREKCPNVKVVE